MAPLNTIPNRSGNCTVRLTSGEVTLENCVRSPRLIPDGTDDPVGGGADTAESRKGQVQMPKTVRTLFDAAYYRRFYENPRTAVTGREETAKLVRFVIAYLDFLGIRVQDVLDVGCGLGLWRGALAECRPEASYTGLEVSEHLCERFGWEHGSVITLEPRRRYDLVVCQGVLPYLPGGDVGLAVSRLSAACRGALYVEAITREDYESGACDRRRTDPAVHLRSGRWYRRQLAREFVSCGGGVFLPRATRAVLYELEREPLETHRRQHR